ncbi:MAG: hypothetical protein ABR998_07475 [Gemmatimonadales bacterium]
MSIQPLLQPSPPRSKAVTAIAWLTILSGAYITFSAGSALVMGRASVGLVVSLAAALFTMIAGAALNQREEWARQGFIFVQALSILGAVIRVVASGVSVGAVFGLVITLAINGWIVTTLRSPAVRAEFEDDE